MDIGRLIMPALRWRDDTGFAHEQPAIDAALALGAGGFILFGGTAPAVRALTERLEREAGRPLLIGADLERGAGQQFQGLTQLPPPRALGALDEPHAIRWAGGVTGAEARSVGVNWVFAPVADLDLLAANPIVQTRAFGAVPARVGRCVRLWIEGCQAAGALACAKHFPGHGRTSTDSHAELPVVDADAATLRATDLLPFAAAANAGVAAIMTAHVRFPALDAAAPATFSRPILGLLRDELGFDGLVVSDALIMEGARVGRTEGDGAVDAIAAGVDVLLYPNDVRAVHDALRAALADGRLAEARAAEALRRYERALAAASAPVQEPAAGPYADAPSLADALLETGTLRAAAPVLAGPVELLVVDDDVGGPYPASPSDYVAQALERDGVALGPGGSRVVLAYHEPRAWKGRAGFGPHTAAQLAEQAPDAALVVLFGHPRLVDEIPGRAPVLVAWHRQRLMQEAVARWIVGRVAGG